MPYFVYRIKGQRQLEHLETFPKYRDARNYVRETRESEGDVDSIRMIFAKNDVEAEKLLSTPRDERVIGED